MRCKESFFKINHSSTSLSLPSVSINIGLSRIFLQYFVSFFLIFAYFEDKIDFLTLKYAFFQTKKASSNF